jgi:hypothetical protein
MLPAVAPTCQNDAWSLQACHRDTDRLRFDEVGSRDIWLGCRTAYLSYGSV